MEVRIDALTRVEGEGALDIRIREGKVEDLKLRIYEPPRFFEQILKGKPYHTIPDITARICGICPVAYQMSGVQAVEDAFSVKITEELERIRRLMYYGEWIQSHALHVFFLHLPDFYNVSSILELSKMEKSLVNAGLEIKKAGSKTLEKLGGRVSHPVSVKVGGFYKLPESLEELEEPLERAMDISFSLLEKFKGLHFPKMELKDIIFVSLEEEDYPILKGHILTSDGMRIRKEDFKEFFEEYTVEYSSAKRSKRKDGKVYATGPISRFNNCYEKLSPMAKEYAKRLNLEAPEKNPYKSILVRMVEIVHCLERSIKIVKDYRRPESSQIEYKAMEGKGYGVSEAPRGILWHSYSFDKEGKIKSADIVPPTSQNQDVMELSLLLGLEEVLSQGEERIRDESEKVIRCFDPCISCATHFLRVFIS